MLEISLDWFSHNGGQIGVIGMRYHMQMNWSFMAKQRTYLRQNTSELVSEVSDADMHEAVKASGVNVSIYLGDLLFGYH